MESRPNVPNPPVTFRIETDGPVLLSRGRYGAGEARYLGPRDGRTHEHTHAFACLAVVVSGSFDFRTPVGSATAAAGSLIFGHADEAFSYRYHERRGAHRSVIALSEELLSEVAASCGFDEARFAVAAIPPQRATAALYGLARRIVMAERDLEDDVFDLVAHVLTFGRRFEQPSPSARQRRRVRDVARLIDIEYAQPFSLDDLAERARLSKFHFLRAFREEIGESPGRYLAAARLRAAADRLIVSREPISSIALRVGFNDLSHFNATFRETFGATPGMWRMRAQR